MAVAAILEWGMVGCVADILGEGAAGHKTTLQRRVDRLGHAAFDLDLGAFV